CVLELRLRQRPRTMFEEELEQTQRERRQVNRMPFSQHLPSVGIEETGTKGNPHRHRLEKSRKSAGTRQGLGSALGATVILAETPAFTVLTRLWRSAGGHGGDHVFPLFSNRFRLCSGAVPIASDPQRTPRRVVIAAHCRPNPGTGFPERTARSFRR